MVQIKLVYIWQLMSTSLRAFVKVDYRGSY